MFEKNKKKRISNRRERKGEKIILGNTYSSDLMHVELNLRTETLTRCQNGVFP